MSKPVPPAIVAIATGHVALQLALSGIHVEEARDTGQAEAAVAGFLAEPPQLLILQENLPAQFSDVMQDRLARHKGAPLITYCPEFIQEDSGVDAYLNAVLKPAIGYELRLE